MQMFRTLSLIICTASIVSYTFDQKGNYLKFSRLSVFKNASTSRLGNNHKRTEELVPLYLPSVLLHFLIVLRTESPIFLL